MGSNLTTIRRRVQHAGTLVLLSVSLGGSVSAQSVRFSQVIDDAMKHSGTMAIAAAEAAHARASLSQARDAYIPQAIVGSGLGASFGFPLTLEGSAPSIINFNTQSMVLNFPQRDYIRSAQMQWQAASTQ